MRNIYKNSEVNNNTVKTQHDTNENNKEIIKK